MNAVEYCDPSEKSYFYGRLLREEANKILEQNGCKDGLFLLRESVFEIGSYILSLCFAGQIQHYKIDRQENGRVAIAKASRTFIGPCELIDHHRQEASGLVTRLVWPCDRAADLVPIKYLFVHDVDLYNLVNRRILAELDKKHANNNDNSTSKHDYARDLEEAKGRFRYKYEKIVLKRIHFNQAWFLDNSSRQEANRLLTESGLVDGKFLLRRNKCIHSHDNKNDDKNEQENLTDLDSEYKISLCFRGEIKHYQVKTRHVNESNSFAQTKYFIDDSFEFDTLIQLIDYFHRCSAGFLCNLRLAYLPRQSYNHFQSESFTKKAEKNIYNSNRMYNAVLNESSNSKSGGTINYIDDEPNNSSGDITNLNSIPEKKRPLFENEENYEYDSLDRVQKMNTIDHRNLWIYDKLGTGCFASVYRGIYRLKAASSGGSPAMQEIPVAIKKLNMENMDESRKEIEKEAELMRSLENLFIIKFIGLCFNYENSSIMIVLELAKLGPLHKYLRAHHHMSMFKIVKICYQVSIAMNYLAEKKLIHRDLAARNVLLVSEDIAKVSDFGLSRKMNEFNCYETHAHGKWPLKWYPPDATLGKFDEKSDVWSFGVTCWEATSYGARPYQGIEISTLLHSLQNGHRLGKPSKCPDEVYNLMLKCWHADKNQRPNFGQIRDELKHIIFQLYQTFINYN